ncbi:bifunctional indole-3-glycerol-phosphate synthase TrpC/phosphoribosylanthranilate isomerase TrpF [Dongshaea marina]|uniref:bifunctional indole-3-glycerol-phosphate synthase TrpC/phosphoribosylanthranilate isomerase TrpF n=1 Tax=Dongshaea marina TaxID=2047966 RepID=UPI000D3E756D|nr:bifunctional indole-3-glycerol-phosphate synthase TrpC/phosphoribosylanthranilate isomerase TrpF [Dongshaea marina]
MSLPTILDKIVTSKRSWIEARKKAQPLEAFIDLLIPSDRSFERALTKETPAFILECKKASPSKGLIREDFCPEAIARTYKEYADVVSVLTDSEYFQGEFEFLPRVRQELNQPVLCKDFIIDSYQIYLARHYQADAVLLMLSVLNDEEYQTLAKVAQSLKMGILTEVSTPEELTRAIALNARVIGINNRNLRDLSIDLERTPQLAEAIPADRIVISESGILNHAHVKKLKSYANGFLVGSSLMAEDNLGEACRKLIYGENKVCGLTRPEDARAAYEAGAIFGGLIFAQKSPRCVSEEQARSVMAAAPLRYVGVFVNEAPERVAELANTLGLSAVQLHGVEDDTYIRDLRPQLGENCEIWKAAFVGEEAPQLELAVDRYVLDKKPAKQLDVKGQQTGGTGQSFDWELLKGLDKSTLMLAGGLAPENIRQASEVGCIGLDINSGVESAPGIKDQGKINQAFAELARVKARGRK